MAGKDAVVPGGADGKVGKFVLVSETSSLPGGPFGVPPVGVALEARRVEVGSGSPGPSSGKVVVGVERMDISDDGGEWLEVRRKRVGGVTDKSRGGVTKGGAGTSGLGRGSRPLRGGGGPRGVTVLFALGETLYFLGPLRLSRGRGKGPGICLSGPL